MVEHKSLYNRMYTFNHLKNKINEIQTEIKDRTERLTALLQEQKEIEQSFLDELAESGLKEKFLRLNDTVFCIYPHKVKIIETETGF